MYISEYCEGDIYLMTVCLKGQLSFCINCLLNKAQPHFIQQHIRKTQSVSSIHKEQYYCCRELSHVEVITFRSRWATLQV